MRCRVSLQIYRRAYAACALLIKLNIAMQKLSLLGLLAVTGALAQPAARKAEVWFGPPGAENGKYLRELLARPAEWAQTRSLIDVFFYADHTLDRNFQDGELRGFFSQLREWKLKFAMEFGAVKEWGTTGEKVFRAQQPKWDRFIRLGADLHAIAMDEPLICVRKRLNQPDAYAVEQTADFIARVRKQYPKMLIGEIETYPSIPIPDHLWWIDALNRALEQKGVRGLDFYRLDVNWVVYNTQGQGSWREVRKLEDFCRSKHIPFSLIYWAAGYPALARKGLAADDTWYTQIMLQGADYALVGGSPDQFVIESWIGQPKHMAPENGDFTFTRSVRDFVLRFVKPAATPSPQN